VRSFQKAIADEAAEESLQQLIIIRTAAWGDEAAMKKLIEELSL
jgi:hypothetical protein